MLAREIYVADSEDEAREEAEVHFEYRWKTFFGGNHGGVAVGMSEDNEWVKDKHYEMLDPHGKAAVNFDIDEYIVSGQVLLVTPEDVTEKLKTQYDEAGRFGTLFVGAQIGDLPIKMANENLRRISEEVMPELKEYTDNTDVSPSS